MAVNVISPVSSEIPSPRKDYYSFCRDFFTCCRSVPSRISPPIPDEENLVAPPIKAYRPFWKRVSVLVGLDIVAGVASSFIFPRLSLPPTFSPLIMSPFLDAFAKSGKQFLDSFPTIQGKALAVVSLFGGAALWDLVTNLNPSDIKSWGLTALTAAVALRFLAVKIAKYQKPLKD